MKKTLLLAGLILLTYVGVVSALDEVDIYLRGNLREAARAGDVARTTSLLRWRWLYNINGGVGVAAAAGHADVVALLIEAGAPVDAGLSQAARAGHMEVVALLIEEGADLSSYVPLNDAAWEGHADVVALLIEAGAEMDKCSSNNNGLSGLEAGIGNALNRIVGSPQRMSARAHSGPLRWRCYPMPLRAAILKGHTDIARMLIEAGANVLAGIPDGDTTPVELARKEGQADMIRLLDAAVELPTASNVINAAQQGDWDRLSRVVARGAEVNQPETSHRSTYDWTALMYAAEQGQVDIVTTLLDVGAEVTHASPDSATAVSLATANGHEAVVELLRTAGAQR